jgi:hypothetical protein
MHFIQLLGFISEKSMNRKNKLISAILELKYLLDTKNLKESKCQKYFEENPIVFDVLGYQEAIPMVKGGIELEQDETTGLKPEPDFIVKNQNNLYEIFEIKTPSDKKLVVDRNPYRVKFTAEVSSYISQTITYEKYFTRNPQNRLKLKENHGVEIQEDLDIKIVIGQNEYINKAEIHSKCREFSWKVDIITYDDIYEKLKKEYQLNFGLYEDIPGGSFHFICRFHKQEQDGYFMDIGKSTFQNRVSFYISNNNDFVFQIIDDCGKKHAISFDDVDTDFYERWLYLVCEFCSIENSFYMALSIDGLEKQAVIKNRAIKVGSDFVENLHVGCSIDKNAFGVFDVGEQIMYPKTLDYENKNNMIGYLIRKYGRDLETKSYMQFDGTKFLQQNATGLGQSELKYIPKYINNKA